MAAGGAGGLRDSIDSDEIFTHLNSRQAALIQRNFCIDDSVEDITVAPSPRKASHNRTVKFAPDTRPPVQTLVATAIVNHEFLPQAGTVIYRIKCW